MSAKLYVDDLTLSTTGLPLKVVRMMAAAVTFVIARLEETLGLQVSAKKSVTVAGKVSLAVATAQAIKDQKVKAVRHAKLLGTDSAGGRRRSTHTFRVRLHQFTKTIPRYHAMRRVGVHTKHMVRAAGIPAILRGALEVPWSPRGPEPLVPISREPPGANWSRSSFCP